MKLIYVASPYAGDVERNVEYAKQACRTVMESGHAFFAPHLLYPAVLDDAVPEERQTGIEMGLTLLHRCDELWAFGSVTSSGMQAEIEEAERLRMDISEDLAPERLLVPEQNSQTAEAVTMAM